MIGPTQKGPLNKPTLITSFSQFLQLFGGFLAEDYGAFRYLPYSVEGFFLNGGERVYVTRVGTERMDHNEKVVSEKSIIGENSAIAKNKTGLYTLTNIDEISLVTIPNGTSQRIQNALIEHCKQMKNRFAILDSIQNADLEQIIKQKSLIDSKNAALYYPWITIKDPISAKILCVPPSGHICGIFAQNDIARGVHKAPANEIVRGALSLQRNDAEIKQNELTPIGVNCLVDFKERGIRVWGARTTSSEPQWKYVNVRRLVLYLETSIERGIQWAVFEPNNERLWARVKQAINEFLYRIWADGALKGNTPEEAFFVKCDSTTMTQNDINDGRLIIVIGVAPMKPAEFYIFRIAQWQGGSEVSE
jgi:phage tail sheath protein FI